MKALYEIIQALPSIDVPQEGKMYSFSDLRASLTRRKWICVGNESITPFYVCHGKRIEFYYGELDVRLVNEYNFEKHLLQITGKQRISEVAKEIISLQEHCYVEVLQEAPFLPSARIVQYIEYILSLPDVKNSAIQSFSTYDEANMMFTFFREK